MRHETIARLSMRHCSPARKLRFGQDQHTGFVGTGSVIDSLLCMNSECPVSLATAMVMAIAGLCIDWVSLTDCSLDIDALAL